MRAGHSLSACAAVVVLASLFAASARAQFLPGEKRPPPTAQAQKYTATVFRQVDSVFSRWRGAMEQNDSDAIAALYSKNAVVQLGDSTVLRGQKAIQQQIRGAGKVSAVRTSDAGFAASDEVAVTQGWMTVVSDLPNGGLRTSHAPYATIFRRQSKGQWLIELQSLGAALQELPAASPSNPTARGPTQIVRAQAQVDSVFSRWRGVLESDPRAAADLYTDDAVVLMGDSTTLHGRDEIRQHMSGLEKASDVRATPTGFTVSNEVAVEQGWLRVIYDLSNGGIRMVHGTYAITFRRQNQGAWLIELQAMGLGLSPK